MTRSRDIADQQKNLGGAVSPITAGKNAVINGGFDIWQRGTSFATNYAYTADRWVAGADAGTFTASRSTDVPSTFTYSLSMAGTNTTSAQIYQIIESQNSAHMAGQTVTLTVYAKSTVGSSGLAWVTQIPGATDNWSSASTDQSGTFTASVSGSWTRYSATFTVGANATRGYKIIIYRNVSATSSTTFYTGVQLELGSSATPFSRAGGTIQGELAACQRYFQRIGNNGGAYYMYTSATVEGTSTLWGTVPLPVTMRTTPSISATSSGNTFTILGYANVNSSVIYLDAAQSGPQSIVMGSNSISGLTLRQSCYIRNLNDTSGTYISMNAEL